MYVHVHVHYILCNVLSTNYQAAQNVKNGFLSFSITIFVRWMEFALIVQFTGIVQVKSLNSFFYF